MILVLVIAVVLNLVVLLSQGVGRKVATKWVWLLFPIFGALVAYLWAWSQKVYEDEYKKDK